MLQAILKQIDENQKAIALKRPIHREHLESLRAYYRIGLTYASNALEGNTLTESETKVVIEEGLTIGGKPLNDHLEATGHAAAFDFIFGLLAKPRIEEKDLLDLHRLFYHKIDSVNAGKYRLVPVIISGSSYPVPGPAQLAALMGKCLGSMEKYENTEHPVIAAAKAHKDFIFIHPFIDGNGRVARLLMNLILLRKGYNIAVIAPILRAEYIRTLEKAHTDDAEFIDLIAHTVFETQKDYLRLLN